MDSHFSHTVLLMVGVHKHLHVTARYPGHVGAGCQISPFYNVPWRLTQAPKWRPASICYERLWKSPTRWEDERAVCSGCCLTLKVLERHKEAIFDNLQWNLTVEDVGTVRQRGIIAFPAPCTAGCAARNPYRGRVFISQQVKQWFNLCCSR